MKEADAKDLAKRIIALAEKEGVEYNAVEEKREGNSRYINVWISIKIK